MIAPSSGSGWVEPKGRPSPPRGFAASAPRRFLSFLGPEEADTPFDVRQATGSEKAAPRPGARGGSRGGGGLGPRDPRNPRGFGARRGQGEGRNGAWVQGAFCPQDKAMIGSDGEVKSRGSG